MHSPHVQIVFSRKDTAGLHSSPLHGPVDVCFRVSNPDVYSSLTFHGTRLKWCHHTPSMMPVHAPETSPTETTTVTPHTTQWRGSREAGRGRGGGPAKTRGKVTARWGGDEREATRQAEDEQRGLTRNRRREQTHTTLMNERHEWSISTSLTENWVDKEVVQMEQWDIRLITSNHNPSNEQEDEAIKRHISY